MNSKMNYICLDISFTDVRNYSSNQPSQAITLWKSIRL